ncbi:cyclic nucleotide-binding domain-containing protein [Oceanicoccus sp. KOV_DT_Chl]|uniref:cyclic nucleotide-binding domain-containing protein n=1 Tax=Oceanicoccus sp. KOV_DT_Chl TaxID=1904639 RepID=UPI000C7A81B7|nr:cyclic nucleotide-binding domain-containing protein [Oceanicoccus sp. KOV_DT_Chl]
MSSTSAKKNDLNPKVLCRFQALTNTPTTARAELISKSELMNFAEGDTVFKARKKQHSTLYFLLSGSVEIRYSFDRRIILSHKSEFNSCDLNAQLEDSGSIRATENCTVLAVQAKHIEEMSNQDYEIIDLSDEHNCMLGASLIDDDFQKDWQTEFIQSSIAQNLPAQAIQQLFTCMEDMELDAGDVIFKQGSDGDYFYLIKEGEVTITTESNGAYQGQQFNLEAGQYFGDEALIANTIRNATACMHTEGVVGRIDRDNFNQVIKNHLVTFNSQLDDQPVDIIDVRFPLECKHQTIENSKNIPISLLRKTLDKLNPETRYVIAPANDCRSELATYLMRQAGFNATALAIDLQQA